MLSALAITLCLALGQGPDPGQDIKDQIAILVERLGGAEAKERDAAERAIIALGPKALSLLPAADGAAGEVAQRLDRIRKLLEDRQVAAAAESSRISLKGDMKLSVALEALSKQSHNRIVDHRREAAAGAAGGPDDPTLKLDLDKIPFWEALDEVLDQAHLSTYDYGGERGVYVVDRPLGQIDRKDLAFYSGPFRIAPTRFEAGRDLTNPKGSGMRLTLSVAWEPRLRPIAVTNLLDTVHATGGGDQEIVVQGADTTPETPVGDDNSAIELQIPLELPPREVDQIAKFKGKFAVLVTGEPQTFRFDKLPVEMTAKPVEERKAGVRVMLERVRRNQEIWEASVRVKFENAAESLESHRGWIFNNEAIFVGPDGKPIRPGGFEQYLQEANEVGVKYLFDLPSGPTGMTFIYRTPVGVMKIPVEYELHDLELP